MNEIGGYFGLELQSRNSLHENAIALNSGRNCLEYIIKAKAIQVIYLPFYTCNVLFEVCKTHKVTMHFYHVNESLKIDNESAIPQNAYVVYTNYYGLQDDYIQSLAKRYNNLIVDNSQSLFSKPIDGVDTFYSPRKFVGVPDGGFLYTDKKIPVKDQSTSLNRISHLITRIEKGAQEGYNSFLKNDAALTGLSISKMTNFTYALFRSIDLNEIKKNRIANFEYLHANLAYCNNFKFKYNPESVPMVYPLWIHGKSIHKELINHKLFVAKYWPNVLDDSESSVLEKKLVTELLPLPIDQRYSIKDMQHIVKLIQDYVGR